MTERSDYEKEPPKELPEKLPKIGLIGYTASGKEEAVAALQAEMDIISYPASNVIREYAQNKGIPLMSRDDYWNVRERIDQELGADYLLRRGIDTITQRYYELGQTADAIVFDGIRTLAVADGFKKLPNSLIIAIDADREVRYQRRQNDPMRGFESYEELVQYEKQEKESMDATQPFADVIIRNEGSLINFQRDIITTVKSRFPSIHK
ncbi:MAG TPA: AAA family ATPase [Candidatus Levybacteria bacterium]|nr:AAA family ATPase [Candidatus Levybacteria bacterium]